MGTNLDSYIDSLTILTPEHIFFTSDTHFNHSNIISFCNRPFRDAVEMNETLIRNWNNVVSPDDIVFHLGDFASGGKEAWINILDQLNGHIYLVIGNHDHKKIRQGLGERFEFINMQMRIKVNKQLIYLNHYPYLCFDGGFKNIWQLFGHVHTRTNNTGGDAPRLQYLYPTQYDVGVDNNNYTPISFEQVRTIIQRQIDDHSRMARCPCGE